VEEIFREAAERSGEIVFFTDVTGEILYVNPVFEETYGIRAETAVGRTPGVLEAGFQDPGVFEPFWSALMSGTAVGEETVHRARDGTQVHLETEVHPIHDGSGSILGFLTVQRDLTERRALEEALEESESRFRTLFQRVPEGMGFLDREGRIIQANPELARLMGESVDSLQNRRFHDYLSPGEGSAFRHRVDTVAGGVTDPTGEYHLLGASGTPVPVRASSRMVRMGGRPVVLLTVQDLTEVRRLESRLIRSQRLEAVGRLAAGVAHEFNDLLTVIRTQAELLVRSSSVDGGTDGEGMAGLREVLRGAEKGRRLARKLLAVSAGGDLSFGRVEMDRLLLALRPTLRQLLPANVSIEIFVPEGLPPVRADHASVEQLILDLAAHAGDIMPCGGALAFRLARSHFPGSDPVDQGGRLPGEFLCLTCLSGGDPDGAPEDPSILRDLPAARTGGKGPPEGLSAVRGLVEAHGGMLNLYSGPGEGSTVRVCLPVAAPDPGEVEDPAEGDREERNASSIPGNGETILLVDDDPALRRAAERTLESAGYRVLAAGDGRAALELLLELGGTVDLVLADLVMPRMGGRRLYQAVRREGWRTPFLFASGYETDRSASGRDFDAAVPFIPKPWTVRELTGMVRQVLDGMSGC